MPLVAVTLGAAALATPASALAAPAAALAPPAAALAPPAAALATTAARSAPAAAVPNAPNAMAGYVWADNGTSGGPFYTYNTSGGAVTVTAGSTGKYSVTFAGLGSIARKAMVQVTSYGSSNVCSVGSWGPSIGGADLVAYVDCYGMRNSHPANTSFDLIVTRPVSAPTGTFDYSWVYKTTATGMLTGYQYNSSHKANSVRHLGPGAYQVTLGGPNTTGTSGVVKVSAYGDLPGDCELVSWHGSPLGEVVNVDCFTYRHVPENRRFMVTYAATNNLMGTNNQTTANAFANGTAASYQPPVQYDSHSGARITVVRTATGRYDVKAAGSRGSTIFGGDVQVNAVGSSGTHCYVVSWTSGTTPNLYVACYSRYGTQVNSPFDIEWVVP